MPVFQFDGSAQNYTVAERTVAERTVAERTVAERTVAERTVGNLLIGAKLVSMHILSEDTRPMVFQDTIRQFTRSLSRQLVAAINYRGDALPREAPTTINSMPDVLISLEMMSAMSFVAVKHSRIEFTRTLSRPSPRQSHYTSSMRATSPMRSHNIRVLE
jgi:hypothetical protein